MGVETNGGAQFADRCVDLVPVEQFIGLTVQVGSELPGRFGQDDMTLCTAVHFDVAQRHS